MLSRMGININTSKNWMSTNERTITANNLSPTLDGAPKFKTNAPGILKNNQISTAMDLRDAKNLDFRPRLGSILASGGAPIKYEDIPAAYPKSYFEQFVQSDPMPIGAYRADIKNYKIPGFKGAQASTPVPPNKSNTVKLDADLMWLKAYQSQSNHIYFGSNKEALSKADKNSPEFMTAQNNNIFTPPSLEENIHYSF